MLVKSLVRIVHKINSTFDSLSLRERVGVRGYNAQVISCTFLSVIALKRIELFLTAKLSICLDLELT